MNKLTYRIRKYYGLLHCVTDEEIERCLYDSHGASVCRLNLALEKLSKEIKKIAIIDACRFKLALEKLSKEAKKVLGQ
jgi:hypothetical protein